MTWWNRVWTKFLTIFGEIRVFKYPFWMVYMPDEFKIEGHHYYELRTIIKPGDILLRGYNSYLDGYFIPGRYSHAAIYIGSDKELIIHAMTPDVQYTNLATFLRCDRLCVIRPLLDHYAIDQALQKAKGALGRPYDYDFRIDQRVEVADREFFCSELIYHCYEHAKDLLLWKLKVRNYMLFKKTLFTPDDILPKPGAKCKVVFEV